MLESLVVLALVAMVAGMAAQLLASALRQAEAGDRRAHPLRHAARDALPRHRDKQRDGGDRRCLRQNLCVARRRKPGALPADALINLDVAHSQHVSGRAGAITFFPDGASTGADITVQLPDARARIGVNWLTGATTCSVV